MAKLELKARTQFYSMRTLSKDGISLAQYTVLLHLAAAGGSDYLQDIAQETGVSLSTINRLPEFHFQLVHKVPLEPTPVMGGSRPRDTGLELTELGKNYIEGLLQ